MAIDILPTLAEATDATLPSHIIDGKSAWSLLKGIENKSPQEAYFFYYRINELHGVRYGKWKMYFPHRYRTMEGQIPGKDGQPGSYNYIDLEGVALYDLSKDLSETKNLAEDYPEVVLEINLLANEMRSRLGDSLMEIDGEETRLAGSIE
jgi:arylsulfatase